MVRIILVSAVAAAGGVRLAVPLFALAATAFEGRVRARLRSRPGGIIAFGCPEPWSDGITRIRFVTCYAADEFSLREALTALPACARNITVIRDEPEARS